MRNSNSFALLHWGLAQIVMIIYYSRLNAKELIKVNEGEEPKEVWSLLGGSKDSYVSLAAGECEGSSLPPSLSLSLPPSPSLSCFKIVFLHT